MDLTELLCWFAVLNTLVRLLSCDSIAYPLLYEKHCYSCASENVLKHWQAFKYNYQRPSNFTALCREPIKSSPLVASVICRGPCITIIEEAYIFGIVYRHGDCVTGFTEEMSYQWPSRLHNTKSLNSTYAVMNMAAHLPHPACMRLVDVKEYRIYVDYWVRPFFSNRCSFKPTWTAVVGLEQILIV
ncbi:unnamed protein product [Soboliphyme baturini]|uniref:LCCL domain-containing protein n=1 Tax=Soboliphyme baturini TaxID=241478 RepID=A0A183IFK1_9BILA|nr:unnamed protein product [Soboliphyme baturini]